MTYRRAAEGEGKLESLVAAEGFDAEGQLILLASPMAEGGSTLEYRYCTYDAKGRLSSETRAEAETEEPFRRETILRDLEGRPSLLLIEEQGEITFSLEYSYSGSGESALIRIMDGYGKLIAYDEVILGEGAASGLALRASRFDPAGRPQGELFASVDWRALLSRIEYLAPPELAEVGGPAGADPTKKPETAKAKEDTAAAAPPPPGYLLTPALPGAAPWKGGPASGGPRPRPFPVFPVEASEGGEGRVSGSADFLYDGEARLLRARAFDPEGQLLVSIEYEYDWRGLLTAETRGESSSGASERRIEYKYLGFKNSLWIDRQVFEAQPAPTDSAASDAPASLRYFERRVVSKNPR
jgi:YD repeat-containing protein